MECSDLLNRMVSDLVNGNLRFTKSYGIRFSKSKLPIYYITVLDLQIAVLNLQIAALDLQIAVLDLQIA